ncbi:MAG: YihY/virulence factor BrkB family protein [Oscillospiraceae bacterium]|nr:YihY/virulence factor BrkB family protein [Oscillospiraceae bacterium]
MNYIKKSYSEIRSFAQELERNSVGAYSAQAAFFVITSFFPFMLLMVSLLQFMPLDETVITSNLRESLSGELLGSVTGNFLAGIIREVTIRATPGALLGVAGISAIWAASRCLLSIIQGLNKVYSADSKRSWIKLRLFSVIYVFALQLIIIIFLSILVFGEQINNWLATEFGLYFLNKSVINLRWLIGLLLLILVFVIIYAFVPERKTRFFSELPGALLSAAGWLGFSGIFSLYIDNFSDYGTVYGSLAAAVILMLWLYFCMYILFVGAQYNAWLQSRGTVKGAVKAKIINK